MFSRCLAGLVLAAVASSAEAGAWAQKKGRAQVIVKAEAMRADEGYDPAGRIVPLPAVREDRAVGVFAEYGMTDRLTLQFKGEWQSGEDAFVDYEGRGPLQAGVVWQVWRNDAGAISLQGSYAIAGDGRNAGYAAPGVGGNELEVRVAGGWTFDDAVPKSRLRRWLYPRNTFIEFQFARRIRDGLPDENRLDLTLGRHFGERWMVLNQTYAGETPSNGTRWVQSETSVVRHLGRWSVQAGWRATGSGRETPASSGPIFGIWRRF
jgi:hypothetical protein